MARYRKKPVVIDAFEFNTDGPSAVPDWFCTALKDGRAWWSGSHLTIATLEGDMRANPGDWIIRGVAGEIHPCKPEIFAITYEDETAESAPPDYCWDADDWETALPWDHRDDLLDNTDLVRVGCAIQLSDIWMARIPVTFDDEGDPDKTEIREFRSEAEAQGALAVRPPNAEASDG